MLMQIVSLKHKYRNTSFSACIILVTDRPYTQYVLRIGLIVTDGTWPSTLTVL